MIANQMKKRALIIVDVQNDFCPGGALAVKAGDEVVEPLNRRIKEFLAHDELVIKSRDWHPPVTKHFQEHGGAWPPHCIQNTHGAEFHAGLIDDPRIVIVSKGMGDEDNYSAFDGTNLDFILHQQQITEVFVGGLATDYCVKQTVLDGIKAGFQVTALTDAMRPVEIKPGDGQRAIAEMQRAGAITKVTSDE